MATIEDYICEHLARPLRLKDGSQVLNDDGKPVTKEEGIAMNRALLENIFTLFVCINNYDVITTVNMWSVSWLMFTT